MFQMTIIITLILTVTIGCIVVAVYISTRLQALVTISHKPPTQHNSRIRNSSHYFTTTALQEIFNNFVSSSSVADWCKWLCISLNDVENDEEKIEIHHTLALLLFHYGSLDNVMKSFVAHHEPFKYSGKSDDIQLSEATLLFSFVQAGDVNDTVHNQYVETYLQNNIKIIAWNPYILGAVLGAFSIRCSDNAIIRNKLRGCQDSKRCVKSMSNLIDSYSKTSVKYRHGMPIVVHRCVYNTMDIILKKYVKDNFGTTEQWFTLLAKLLKLTEIAQVFMLDQSEDLTQLYQDALAIFPVEIQPSISLWGAVCQSSNNEAALAAILSKLSEINCVAELFENIDPRDVRPNGNQEWLLMGNRVVAGVPIKAGSTGCTQDDSLPLIISWILETPYTEITVWDMIFHEIIKPAVRLLNQGGMPSTGTGGEGYLPEGLEIQIIGIAEFLVVFSASSTSISPSLFQLYRPICFILKVLAIEASVSSEKADRIGLLLKLVDGGSKFEDSVVFEYADNVWPGGEPSMVEMIIMGHESVVSCNYVVTKSFLQLLLGIVENHERLKKQPSPSQTFMLTEAVLFVVENILPSYVRWRISKDGDKYEILNYCLQIFDCLFRTNTCDWKALKIRCCDALLAPNGSLLTVLTTDEETLQDSTIKPTLDTIRLPEIIFYSLSLLLKLVTFEKDVIHVVDSSLGLTLVQKLGRFARHRLNARVPTLAMNLLKRIAQEMNMSLLSCFGNESESFRDLVIQRLEYKSEDISLRVAMLEFLTVCAHTQPGLIEHFFMEHVLTERLLELVLEKDDCLQVAALAFIRALFRKGANVLKKCKDLWWHIFEPIRKIEGDGNLEVICNTFHIFSFELFSNGISDLQFYDELKIFLDKLEFRRILWIILSGDGSSESVRKCVLSLKHFLTLFISRPDLCHILPEDTRQMILFEITEKFWMETEADNCDNKFAASLAELMFQLSPSEDPNYLKKISIKLVEKFENNCVSVQVSLLALVNNCIKYSTVDIEYQTIENLVRILTKVFFSAAKVFELDDPIYVSPLLSLAAATTASIVHCKRCLDWESVYHHYYLPLSIVSVAHMGIVKGKGAEVVIECLNVMIKMAAEPRCSRMLQYANLGKNLWMPISRYATPENSDPMWMQVYIHCLHLNSRLLAMEKYYYLGECLNFWGLHGTFIAHKLWALGDMVDRCMLSNPEKNYREMKELLVFNFFALHSVSCMLSFLQRWRFDQACDIGKIMEGVFVTLRTSVGLLSQPNHLLLLISSSKLPNLDFKLTPQLLEIQTKLWDLMALGVHIFWNLKGDGIPFVENEMMMPTLYSIAQLCVKALTKGDRKSHSAINATQRVSTTMEKTMCLLHVRGRYMLQDSGLTSKQLQAATREIATEIATICDGVRRLGLPKSGFLLSMCSSLENSFK